MTSKPNLRALIVHSGKAESSYVQTLMRELPLPAQIVDGFDGADLCCKLASSHYHRDLHMPRYPFELSRCEVACFMSHRRAWQTILEQRLDAGLIIESEIALTAQFPAAFAAALEHLKPDDFIRFPLRDDKERGSTIHEADGVRIIKPVPVGPGMAAQLVGRQAAARLLAVTQQFDRPVDAMLQMTWVTVLFPSAVIPGGVARPATPSDMSGNRHRRPLAETLRRQLMTPFYRRQVMRYSQETWDGQ